MISIQIADRTVLAGMVVSNIGFEVGFCNSCSVRDSSTKLFIKLIKVDDCRNR